MLSRPASTLLILVSTFALSAVPANALLTYPSASCAGTLQACITGAASGEVIEIATNTPVDENLAVSKSLTLRPAAGFTPVIGGGATSRILNFDNLGTSGGAQTVLIEGLHFTNARAAGFVTLASGHSITIRDCVFFFEIANNNTPAVTIDTRVPLTGVIDHNQITSTGQGIQLWAITDAPGNQVSYLVQRNFITTSLPAESNVGIVYQLRGQGTYNVQTYSNAVFAVGGCNCGGNSGISVDVSQTPQITATVTNNTVEGTQFANAFDLLVREAGASVTFNVFNNIASNSAFSGFNIDNLNGATVVVNADRNDSFGNGSADDFLGAPAIGTVLNLNPVYANAAAGDLRLQSSSPLIDAGADAPTGGTSTLDADGNARLLGLHVDLGAYESRLSVIQVPTLQATGLALLAALLVLASLTLLRRRA